MEFLQSMDTPTVCNVVEMVAPERRGPRLTGQAPVLPVPRPAADRRLCQDRDGEGKDKVALGDYMGKAARLSRLHRAEPRRASR
jgi:hypothetical protein